MQITRRRTTAASSAVSSVAHSGEVLRRGCVRSRLSSLAGPHSRSGLARRYGQATNPRDARSTPRLAHHDAGIWRLGLIDMGGVTVCRLDGAVRAVETALEK